MSNKEVDFRKKTSEIFKQLNEYRKNPKILAKHLENLKKYLDKNNVLSEPGKIPIQMVEGEDVINEAIKFLSSIKSLAPFELDPNLCKSAQEHVDDIGPKGMLSYQSSDGTEPEDRISKYGTYVESLGENIDFGPNDAIGVIISLTLDDGEDERPHRDNLFKSEYKKIGIACGPHKTEYQMCVMDFAFDFYPLEEKSSKAAQEVNFQNNKANNSYAQSNSQINQTSSAQNYPKQESKPTTVLPVQQDIMQAKQKDNNIRNPQGNTPVQIQSPFAKAELDFEKVPQKESYDQSEGCIASEVLKLVSKKRILSKLVEVTTKVTYTMEDGSTKETFEKIVHTFTGLNL